MVYRQTQSHQAVTQFTPPAFHARSWYQYECGSSKKFQAISENLRCQTVIVGAGLAGLSTAVSLTERGQRDIVVLEQGQPGEGASGRNGGFVFGGFSLAPAQLARQVGVERAHALQAMTLEAVERVRMRCKRLGVPINEHGVLLADWFKQTRRLRQYAEQLQSKAGVQPIFLDSDEVQYHVRSKRYGAALMESKAFHFNPLQYVRALSNWLIDQGVRIFGDSCVRSAKYDAGRWLVSTDQASVSAEQFVLSSGGYGRSLMPAVQRSIQPIATYIAVTEPLGSALDEVLPSKAAIYDNRFAFDYYRRVGGDRLLWGGRISIRDRYPKQIELLMRKDLKRVFPRLADCRFDFSWGGWMSYARHQMPILTEVEPGFWTAIAFGGHGMAPTTLAGEIMAEALSGNADALQSFRRWQPVWAGGRIGRLIVQGDYYRRQMMDALRDAFSRRQ
ncbi:MAG: FAD-binding oxidoreductase [Pseudomonadota bacterium]